MPRSIEITRRTARLKQVAVSNDDLYPGEEFMFSAKCLGTLVRLTRRGALDPDRVILTKLTQGYTDDGGDPIYMGVETAKGIKCVLAS